MGVGLSQTLGRAAGGGDAALVKIAMFDPVREQDAVALPVEAISKNNSPVRARGNTVEVDRRCHAISHAQVELVGVWLGEGVGLPERHLPILHDERESSVANTHKPATPLNT